MEKPRPPQTIITNTQTNYNQKILKIKTDNIKPSPSVDARESFGSAAFGREAMRHNRFSKRKFTINMI